MESFEVTYENDDGYAGGSRPHHLNIDTRELDNEMTDEELVDLFWERIEDDFEQRHKNLYSDQESEFVSWAREQISLMND